MFTSTSTRWVHGLIGTFAAFLTTALFLNWDKMKFRDIGLKFERKTAVRFFTGVLAGLIIMAILATGVLYFTNAEIISNPETNLWRFLLMTSPLILLAFMEELGFRAYPLEILKDRTGIRSAIIMTSILFSLYHMANGWSVASSFLGPFIWGLVFGLSAVYSKGIAMPTGIHYAANLTTAAFGDVDNTTSIWVVQQPSGAEVKTAIIDWTIILPALALLIFAIALMEFYLRKKTGKHAFEKPG